MKTKEQLSREILDILYLENGLSPNEIDEIIKDVKLRNNYLRAKQIENAQKLRGQKSF